MRVNRNTLFSFRMAQQVRFAAQAISRRRFEDGIGMPGRDMEEYLLGSPNQIPIGENPRDP
jgi:hypothetical protein